MSFLLSKQQTRLINTMDVDPVDLLVKRLGQGGGHKRDRDGRAAGANTKRVRRDSSQKKRRLTEEEAHSAVMEEDDERPTKRARKTTNKKPRSESAMEGDDEKPTKRARKTTNKKPRSESGEDEYIVKAPQPTKTSM